MADSANPPADNSTNTGSIPPGTAPIPAAPAEAANPAPASPAPVPAAAPPQPEGQPVNQAQATPATSGKPATSEKTETQAAAPAPAPATPEPAETPAPVEEPKPAPAAPPEVSSSLSRINRDLKEKAIRDQAQRMGLSYMDIEKTPINPDLTSIVHQKEAADALVIPFFRIGKKLRVAVFDPKRKATEALIEKLKKKGYLINLNLASDDGINAALDRLYASQKKYNSPELVTQVKEDEIQAYEKEIENLVELKDRMKSITAEEALNMLTVGAVKTNASDIHFQPEEDVVLVRFRIDGVLQKIFDMERKVFENLSNQIKYKGGMKLNISNVPQDGRFYFTINERKIDVRVSALPTEYGETFVLRLLDSGKGFLDFKDCGFIGRNLKLMDQAIKISHGMILVTGPTGSGKTTTLYSMLNQFNQPEVKIITLEDPIEYHLRGISQSQINVKRGYNFGEGLRAILRQDPDVVMVGEIRDMETAETASQAALTGHVMLSTLHTNSAVEAIPRLINVGLPPFMVAPAMHMIVAQRLVRKLCENCRNKAPITEVEKAELEEVCANAMKLDPSLTCQVPTELWHPGECDQCSHTGYSGQIGIHEILLINDELKQLILNNASSNELKVKAREQGMLTMREDGLLKVTQEITTIEEVHRVTQEM